MEKQNGKSILITGANGGLALETVKLLAEDGFDYIIMACRTLSKATEARKQVLEMRKATTPITVQAYGGFDMNDPVQIAQAVNELSAERRLDVVFLAAGGVIFSDTYETKSWAGHTIEKTVFQNVIGAHLTLHHLKERFTPIKRTHCCRWRRRCPRNSGNDTKTIILIGKSTPQLCARGLRQFKL